MGSGRPQVEGGGVGGEGGAQRAVVGEEGIEDTWQLDAGDVGEADSWWKGKGGGV